MYDFNELIELDEKTFENKLLEIDSSELIDYIKNCDNLNIRNKYFRIIKKIYGKHYLEQIKIYIIYNNKYLNTKNRIIKSILYIINFMFSGNVSLILFDLLLRGFSFNRILHSIEYYIFNNHIIFIIDDFIKCIYLITPFLVVYIISKYIIKIKTISIIFEIFMFIIISIIMSYIYTKFELSFLELLQLSYEMYISVLLGGILFRILLHVINKIYILK